MNNYKIRLFYFRCRLSVDDDDDDDDDGDDDDDDDDDDGDDDDNNDHNNIKFVHAAHQYCIINVIVK